MPESRQSRVRYLIITILFVVSCFSFADRSLLSQAAGAMPAGLNLNAGRLSYLLFAFGWAYALGQLPSGGLLDRFGSKRVYGIAIIGWSIAPFSPPSPGTSPPARLHRHLHPRSALRPFPVARLSRQRPHRRRLVSHFRARPRLGHLQLRAVFRSAHLCAYLRGS
jgi:hypothetical protein